MFRSCLFFYDLSTVNVKEKREFINHRVIRSGYDFAASAACFGAADKTVRAPALSAVRCSISPPAEVCRLRASRNADTAGASQLASYSTTKTFSVYISFCCAYIDYFFTSSKWSNSKHVSHPAIRWDFDEHPRCARCAQPIQAIRGDLKQLTQDLVQTNSMAIPPGRYETPVQQAVLVSRH
jgi:hypothetical protein